MNRMDGSVSKKATSKESKPRLRYGFPGSRGTGTNAQSCSSSQSVISSKAQDENSSGSLNVSISEVRSLREELIDWAIKCEISLAALTGLLKILSEHHPEDNLPTDGQSLLSDCLAVISLKEGDKKDEVHAVAVSWVVENEHDKKKSHCRWPLHARNSLEVRKLIKKRVKPQPFEGWTTLKCSIHSYCRRAFEYSEGMMLKRIPEGTTGQQSGLMEVCDQTTNVGAMEKRSKVILLNGSSMGVSEESEGGSKRKRLHTEDEEESD